MIPYEQLVAALKDWRSRNGLPNTPPDFGDPVPPPAYRVEAPVGPQGEDVYDLSEDSDLIMADDATAAEADLGQVYDSGGIQTAMEMSAESRQSGAYDQYDQPPGTDAYGMYPTGDGEPRAEATAVADAGTFGDVIDMDDAGVEPLEADASDVVEEMSIDAAAVDVVEEHEVLDEVALDQAADEESTSIADAGAMVDDDYEGGATMVAQDPSLRAEEPEALEPPPMEPPPLAPEDDEER